MFGRHADREELPRGASALIGGSGVSLDGKSLILPEGGDDVSSINTANYDYNGNIRILGTMEHDEEIPSNANPRMNEVMNKSAQAEASGEYEHKTNSYEYHHEQTEAKNNKDDKSEASDESEAGGGCLPLWITDAPTWLKLVIVMSTALLVGAIVLIGVGAALAVQEDSNGGKDATQGGSQQLGDAPFVAPSSPPAFVITTAPVASDNSPTDGTPTAPTEPTPMEPSEPTSPTPDEPTAPTPTEPTEPSAPTPAEPTEPTGPTPTEPTEPTGPTPTAPPPTDPPAPTEPPTAEPAPTDPDGSTGGTPTGPDGSTGGTPTDPTDAVDPTEAPVETPTTEAPVTAAPTVAPDTDSPTRSPTSAPTSTNVSFFVTGGRFTQGSLAALPDQLATLPNIDGNTVLFHLGDWNSPFATSCVESSYEDNVDLYKNSAVPVYFVPGDNEFNDCPNPVQAFGFWYDYILDFETTHYPAPTAWNISRQEPDYSENFAFVQNGCLILGINLVGGELHDSREWEDRHAADLEWIDDQFYLRQGEFSVMVVLAHADPDIQPNAGFFNTFYTRVEEDYQIQVIYIHRNLGVQSWALEPNFNGISNLMVVVVEGSVWPPMLVEIDTAAGTLDIDQEQWYKDYLETGSV